MTILVTYASKHGSTKGIAKRVAEKFQQLGLKADICPVEAVMALDDYRAVVIGSALYYGSWLKAGTEFIRHNRAVLSERPVWLFSSGPLGTEVEDAEQQPKELPEFQEAIKPRGHRIFFGALDRDELSFIERMVIKGVRAPAGDYRDWGEIEAWAESIAHALAPAEITPGQR